MGVCSAPGGPILKGLGCVFVSGAEESELRVKQPRVQVLMTIPGSLAC